MENKALVRISISISISIVTELEDQGLQVRDARNAHEAISVLRDNLVVNVTFTNVDMPGGIDGITLAKIIRERFSRSGGRHVTVSQGALRQPGARGKVKSKTLS